MFNFFNKKDKTTDSLALLPFDQDIHSHILPGIDDGAPDMHTSIQLIRGLYEMGIRKTIATPHIIGDLYRNTPETIQAALDKTKRACEEAGINIEIRAAAEYMLDDHFMTLLTKNEPLLTLHKNLLLTELSYNLFPDNLHEMVFRIITHGYQPILAHPERYFYFHQDYDSFNRLKDLGFHLQVNLLSLTGYYGKEVAKAAVYIIKNGLAKLVGTDLHHMRHLNAIQQKRNILIFKKYLGRKEWNADLGG